jgi:GGDEF domain-containing protein
MARVLRATFRAEHVVTRIGGDEFAVLLASADAKCAKEALERVCISKSRITPLTVNVP